MKFLCFLLPSLPARLEERKALRPIASHPEKWQHMIEEVVEVARVAEDVGFDAVAFPEHHLHSEGIEMGSLPVLTQHVIHHTKRIKVGPIGYVLPGWNPLRLALVRARADHSHNPAAATASGAKPGRGVPRGSAEGGPQPEAGRADRSAAPHLFG